MGKIVSHFVVNVLTELTTHSVALCLGFSIYGARAALKFFFFPAAHRIDSKRTVRKYLLNLTKSVLHSNCLLPLYLSVAVGVFFVCEIKNLFVLIIFPYVRLSFGTDIWPFIVLASNGCWLRFSIVQAIP